MGQTSVRTAVIPAAGLGTRFLPASKAIPKEMIPIVDKPGIQYAVEEAARAGISRVVIVLSKGKDAIEEHFRRNADLEAHLERTGKAAELQDVRTTNDLAELDYVEQTEQLGLGHAVLTAAELVGDEPFAVLLPDEIVPEPAQAETDLLPKLIALYDRFHASVIAVRRVAHEMISAYGVIDPDEVESGVYRVKDVVEKPAVEDAPSDLAASGRYVLTPEVFDSLRATTPGAGGEIQLTDALRLLLKEQELYAYEHAGPIYDVGKKFDYLKASIELALRRDDLAPALRDYLSTRGDG